MVKKLSIIALIVFAIAGISGSARAQAPVAAVTASVSGTAGESVSAFMDEAGSFTRDAETLVARIADFGRLGAVQSDFDRIEKDLKTHVEEFERRKRLSSWDFRSASELKSRFKPFFESVEKAKSGYADFLKNTDALLDEISAKKGRFKKFSRLIQSDPSLAGQKAPVKEAITRLGGLGDALKKTREDYAKLYQSRVEIIDRADAFAQALQNEIRDFRGAHLRKTAPAFFESEFFASFGPVLWDEARVAVHAFGEGTLGWIRNQGGMAWRLMAAVFVLFWMFRRLKRSERWRHVFQQPLGLALAVTLGVTGFVAPDPAPAAVFAYWLFFGAVLLIVVRGYPLSPLRRRDVSTLVVAMTLLQTVDALALPLPLLRVFLTALAAAVAVYCRRRGRGEKDAGHRFFDALIVLFAVAAVAEAAGYHPLAAFVIRGAVKSGFLVFAAWSAEFLFLPVTSEMLEKIFANLRLDRDTRALAARKIVFVLRLAVVALAVLGLTALWGFFDGVSSAYLAAAGWGVSVAGRAMTLRMVAVAAAWLYAAVALAQVLCSFLEHEVYPRRHIGVGTGKSINALVLYFAWIVGLALAFSSLGFELQQLAIIAGALSVGIGFGLQNIVNNFVSGLILLFERPIKVGDILDIEGQWGTVEKMGLRSTVIRSFAKTQIIIPNSDFVTRKVENLTFSDADYRISIRLGVAYGSDTALVRDLLVGVAHGHPHIAETPEPQAYFIEFGDHSLIFELWAWTNDVANKRQILSDLHFEIDRMFRAKGVVIPFPQRVVRVMPS